MSGDHHRNEPTTTSSTIDKSLKDESNGGGVVVVSSSSSFPSFNSLPMDVLVLIFDYIPQYPRLRVVKFVSKRFHSAVLRSFKAISTQDFNWNWKFVLPRFPSITSLDIWKVNHSNLPDVLPPRISTLNIDHSHGTDCTCSLIEKTSSLTSLSVRQSLGSKCPPLDRLVSNSLSSLTFLELDGDFTPPSTLYLPSLRHFVMRFSTSYNEFLMNHASQLTRLECNYVSYMHDISFPSLRHLDVKLWSEDNTSFMQHCPSITNLNATLSHNGFDANQVTQLLPLVTTISFGADDLLPFLHLATRLTAVDSPLDFHERAMQQLLPVASRLKKLHLQGEEQDCAALLALCPMLEELKLYSLHIDSNASLLLPHLIKLQINLREYSSEEAFQCLNKFLLVAPRLRRVTLILGKIDKSHLVSFLPAAEKAGVERIMLHVKKEGFEAYKEAVQPQWLYVQLSCWSFM